MEHDGCLICNVNCNVYCTTALDRFKLIIISIGPALASVVKWLGKGLRLFNKIIRAYIKDGIKIGHSVMQITDLGIFVV